MILEALPDLIIVKSFLECKYSPLVFIRKTIFPMLFRDTKEFRASNPDQPQADGSLGALKLNSLGISGIQSNKVLSSSDFRQVLQSLEEDECGIVNVSRSRYMTRSYNDGHWVNARFLMINITIRPTLQSFSLTISLSLCGR